MNAVLPLAALFAGIIFVGTLGVYVHDLLEGRSRSRRYGGTGGGGSLVFRQPAGSPERRSASRGGQVVWVRAGSHRPDGSAVDQRRSEPRSVTAAGKRRAWR